MPEKISVLLIFLLVFALVTPSLTAETLQSTFSVERLGLLEEVVTGERNSEEAILIRLEELERKLYGRNMSGSLIERLNRIDNLIFTSSVNRPSIFFSISSIEWILWQELNQGPLEERLLELEELLLGKSTRGNLVARLGELKNQSLPDGRINAKKVEVSEGIQLEVSFLEDLDAGKLEIGEVVEYELVNDLVVEGKMVLAAGIRGTAEVTNLTEADFLGQDGIVELEFADLRMLDGTQVEVVPTDDLRVYSGRELAAGVSILGVATFGPWGAVVGSFVRGSNQVIEAERSFRLEFSETIEVLGISIEEAMDEEERERLQEELRE
ncbi:hypothetical protein [Fuchsiella alkaliacetigena]|uniref:hypothetical protein n=1 Tax=Fuchsiella alkaliacetigena TaxID=957042 RepID=UPI00200B9E5B|nr:hypothetical protein [Fuchsiella alkaliacetigena]MCK8824291.1 hypothetical protein [Fuchsiella alkaliacetigena]